MKLTAFLANAEIKSMLEKRYLFESIIKDLEDRMIFIGGPRQVGKTTFSKELILLKSNGTYLNWDDLNDQNIIKKHEFSNKKETLIFDEIHKYSRWRMLLKGLYDKHKESKKIIATGSARLDYFRKGGDSLFGRYHYYRLHPFSLNELSKNPNKSDCMNLLKFGGFPEPFLKQSESFLRRWQNERSSRVFSTDLRDIVTLKDYQSVELLSHSLQNRVGSLLSKTSLAEDLEKSAHTIESWLILLENIYMCYRILPFGSPRIKANKKQQKCYLWDWSVIENSGARFENFVGSQLLKYCHFLEDTEGRKLELRFLKDKDGHEIDFIVIENKKPLFAVECKTGDKSISKSIHYFSQRTTIPAFYQVHFGEKDYGQEKTGRVLPFWKFSKELGLV
jgi:uncharacterized protein